MSKHDVSRRKFIKTAGYVAPAILTLKAIPSFASSGSSYNPPRDIDRRRPAGEVAPPKQ
jgi:hypothetical protein